MANLPVEEVLPARGGWIQREISSICLKRAMGKNALPILAGGVLKTDLMKKSEDDKDLTVRSIEVPFEMVKKFESHPGR